MPGPEVFGDLPKELPNYSVRMSNLAAAVIKPQLKTLEERIVKYNARYAKLTKAVEDRVGQYLSIPVNTPGVTTPVHDSLQFNLSHDITDEQVQGFLNGCAEHGLPVELFGHKSNARNFVNWGFAPADEPLPMTAKMLSRACDVRMPFMWEDAQDRFHNVKARALNKIRHPQLNFKLKEYIGSSYSSSPQERNIAPT